MGFRSPGAWLLASAIVLAPRLAGAEGGRLLDDDTFAVHPGGALTLDAGVVIGLPAALPTGMSTGVGGGITHTCGCWFAYGLRGSWATANATSDRWDVTHSDFRLRAIGAIRHEAGRGSVGLRLGVGATIVHEVRYLLQSAREDNPMYTRAIDTLPATDLEAVVELHVAGAWIAVVSGGPSVDYFQGRVRGGFTSELGVAWRP